MPLSPAGYRDHARRMGRVQSLAAAHGSRHARGSRTHGRKGDARRGGRAGSGDRRLGGHAGLRERSADRGPALPANDRAQEMGGEMSSKEKFGTLDRRAAVRELLKDRGPLLVVTGLGSSSYDAFAPGGDDANFYLWGAMGGAAMMGLGLALAQPRRPVCVLTGDGEQLMGLGALAT